jgi:hypothetical protein
VMLRIAEGRRTCEDLWAEFPFGARSGRDQTAKIRNHLSLDEGIVHDSRSWLSSFFCWSLPSASAQGLGRFLLGLGLCISWLIGFGGEKLRWE